MAGVSISSARSPTTTAKEPAFGSALKPLTIGPKPCGLMRDGPDLSVVIERDGCDSERS